MLLPPFARRLAIGVTAALALTAVSAAPAYAANDVLNPDAELWTNPSSTTIEAAAASTATPEPMRSCSAPSRVPRGSTAARPARRSAT